MIPNKKSSNKPKSRIVIPQLIKKAKPTPSSDSNKENSNIQTNTNKQQQKYSKTQCQSIYQQQIEAHHLKANQHNSITHKSPKKYQKQIKTNQSTYRCLQGDSLAQESSIQSVQQIILKKNNNGLRKLQQMISSDKMFINPDKWSEYLNKALQDQKFHKALNVFMYSYFIQNYN